MAKLTTTDLTSLTNETSAIANINANNALIETAMENTLSRDGTAPNQMNADIDLNSNDLLNVNNLDAQSLTIAGSSDPFSTAQQAATDAAASAASALTSANDAATSEGNASTSETNAATSETNAAASAAAASAAAAGIKYKEPVLVRTTANVTLSGEQTIDGELTSSSRVLVMDQTAAAENGIYVTGAGAWTRATPSDDFDELVGAAVTVTQGTTHADTVWICTSDAGGTIDVTDVTFSQLSAVYSTATTGSEGIVELATQAEVDAGTDTSRVVTPATLAANPVGPTRVDADGNAQTGAAYTLALSDAAKSVTMSNASANTLTIPTNASVTFPTWTRLDIWMGGAGVTTVQGDTGVTVNGVSGGSVALTQYSGVSIVKVGTDEWYLAGGTVA